MSAAQSKRAMLLVLSGLLLLAANGLPLVAQASSDFGVGGLLGGLRTSPTQKFLPVERAFGVTSEQQAGELLIDIRVTPEHYVYQKQFRFTPVAGLTVGEPTFSRAPSFEDDPEFGRVAVFDQNVQLRVPVTGAGELSFRWQGCAKAGLCYPPQIEKIQVNAPLLSNSDARQASAPANPVSLDAVPDLVKNQPSTQVAVPPSEPVQAKNTGLVSQSAQRTLREQGNLRPLSMPVPWVSLTDLSVQSESVDLPVSMEWQGAASAATPVDTPDLVETDPFGLGERPWLAMLVLFFAGLGLAFTPCVLPMIPILANLVARQHRRSAKHGLALSAAYAVGIASSYAMLGALIATFGHQINLVAWLQQPSILIGFALIFVLLALHTFELLSIRLPQALRGKIERLGQIGQHERWAGSLFGSWLVGFFSALVVSPCVSAPLAGVLLSVSTVGDPLLGALALFALGLGLGTPLMLLGATEGRLLPKAGEWLNWVRQGFGLLLLGVALYLLNRVFSTALILGAWSALFMLLAVWVWSWQGRGQLISRTVALLLGVWAGLQLMGVAQGGHDPWQPLQRPMLTTAPVQTKVETIYSAEQLQQRLNTTPRVLIDVTADWCISCKIMERDLFGTNTPAQMAMWTRVKLDVTEPSAEAKQVLEQLQLFGPPALLFYQNGQLVSRVVGEMNHAELVRQLDQLATP